MKKSVTSEGRSASDLISNKIAELGDWRGQTLSRMRKLIKEADPQVVEEWKWMGTPVWSHPVGGRAGIICTGESYKKVVKLTFAKGASLKDPSGLFNSSLDGNVRRAIDIHEGEKIDAAAFKALVKAAVAENLRSGAPKAKPASKEASKAKPPASKTKRVKLLSGGNPQIAKAEGNAPVQAYIDAMPGWKRDVGRRIDALIVRNVPDVRKAVKWNSPFYGTDANNGACGWFLSFHTFTHFVKVTFFQGTSLRPVPPGGTPKSKDARWIDIREDDQLDEALLSSWITQASALPGWVL